MEHASFKQDCTTGLERPKHGEFTVPWTNQQAGLSAVVEEVSRMERYVESLEQRLNGAQKGYAEHARNKSMPYANGTPSQTQPCWPSRSGSLTEASIAGRSPASTGRNSLADTTRRSSANTEPRRGLADAVHNPHLKPGEHKALNSDANLDEFLCHIVAAVGHLQADLLGVRADAARNEGRDTTLMELTHSAVEMRDTIVKLSGDMESMRSTVQALASRQAKQEQIYTSRFALHQEQYTAIQENSLALQARVKEVQQVVCEHADVIQGLRSGLLCPQSSQLPTPLASVPNGTRHRNDDSAGNNEEVCPETTRASRFQ